MMKHICFELYSRILNGAVIVTSAAGAKTCFKSILLKVGLTLGRFLDSYFKFAL